MSGLHHVTAISGPAPRNLAFYRDVLGLSLVKKTVNFDDPGTWHLYFGNRQASPGSLVTFFPWARAAQGTTDQIETRFAVPKGASGFWKEKLGALSFTDPDGMRLAIYETEEGEGVAITGLAGVKLQVPELAGTASVLTGVLGFAQESETLFTSPGGHVELERVPELARPKLGRGSVHHIAFRAASDAEQQAMARRLLEQHGIAATAQKDRNYFRSIYFREPGGVLFEIATDQPGFAVDEAPDALGQALKLPAFLESERQRIEAVLPPLEAAA